MISTGYALGDCAAAECDSTGDRLSELGAAIKGYAQTAERLVDQIDGFLRRCDGSPSQVPSGEERGGKGLVSAASSHFSRIAGNSARLESALGALDTRIAKLCEIG